MTDAMVVVSDTSPLNYIVLVGCSSVLPALFDRILVPEAVFNELHSAAIVLDQIAQTLEALGRPDEASRVREQK
jgi:predicted nucleic acid-binding protein